MMEMSCSINTAGGEVMDIVTLGIDLAKNTFALHGVDQTGRAVLVKPKVRRDQLLALVAGRPP
jgi:transposase